MIIKIMAFLCLIQITGFLQAQLIDYDSAARRVLVDGTGFGDTQTTINNELGYWRFNDAIGSLNSSANQTALQISNLAPDAICAKSFVWNSITGSHPSGGDAQNSVITSFTLAADTRFKIDFFGAVHFSSYQGYLFITPNLFLNRGLNGGGGAVLHIAGSGVVYVDLTAGDYRLTTAVGASYSCQNDPDCLASVSGYSDFSMTPVDSMYFPGDSFYVPFIPDSYSETESPDHTSVTPDGSVLIRGANSFYSYLNESDGWFDIGGENQAIIDVQSSGIVSGLQLPGNRQGVFKISVGDEMLGDFAADDVIIFADYSVELGSLLLTGLGGAEGVKGIEINYTAGSGDNYIGACGQKRNAAVKLTFDEALVSFDVVMPFAPVTDELFMNGFDG